MVSNSYAFRQFLAKITYKKKLPLYLKAIERAERKHL